MIVMVANNGKARELPGLVGHLYSPGGQWNASVSAYALDNGRFSAGFGGEWDCGKYLDLLDWAAARKTAPLWALVPDTVFEPEDTLEMWRTWSHAVSGYGWPLAFAVQDGMVADDVPAEAGVVFIGGSMSWKFATLDYWCGRFPRVHVGRVNSGRNLWRCWNAGAESVDGTGWFRGDRKQFEELVQFLERQERGEIEAQPILLEAI